MNTEIFLVDTSVWIKYFHRRRDSKNFEIISLIKKFEKSAKVVTCGIVLAEFIQGLGKSQKESAARRILEGHEYLATAKEIYILAGEFSRNLARRGLETPLSDCLIAAIAIAYGVTLVSDDSHFKRFSGLKLKFID